MFRSIVALSLILCLTGCVHPHSAADADREFMKYCEPGSAIVRKARSTPPPPARPASPHGNCKS